MIVAIFVTVLGGAAVVAGLTLRAASSKVRGWPVVSGRIIERAAGPSTTSGASRPGRYFEPKVTYQYTVDGKDYTGHRISLTTKAYDEDKARRVADELPDTVEVHYNPSDPSDALLETSGIGTSILLLIGGAIGLLVGGGLLYSSLTAVNRSVGGAS